MPRYRGAVPSTAGGQTGMLFGAQGDRVPWIESPLHCIYMKGGSWRCLCPRPWKISQWLCRGVLSNFQIGKPAWRKHTHEELLGSSFFPTSAFLLYCTALDRPKKKTFMREPPSSASFPIFPRVELREGFRCESGLLTTRTIAAAYLALSRASSYKSLP